MKLIDRREFCDLLALGCEGGGSAFHVALTSNPISAALSVERTVVMFGRVRYGFIYDAQVGKSGGSNQPFRL